MKFEFSYLVSANRRVYASWSYPKLTQVDVDKISDTIAFLYDRPGFNYTLEQTPYVG